MVYQIQNHCVYCSVRLTHVDKLLADVWLCHQLEHHVDLHFIFDCNKVQEFKFAS